MLRAHRDEIEAVITVVRDAALSDPDSAYDAARGGLAIAASIGILSREPNEYLEPLLRSAVLTHREAVRLFL